jgi:hypothetical protein
MAPIIPFIPLIVAGVGAAVSGVELSNMPSPPKSPTPIASETQQAREQTAAAQAQAQALKDRRGMAATVLTSPLGTQAPAQTQSATLGT